MKHFDTELKAVETVIGKRLEMGISRNSLTWNHRSRRLSGGGGGVESESDRSDIGGKRRNTAPRRRKQQSPTNSSTNSTRVHRVESVEARQRRSFYDKERRAKKKAEAMGVPYVPGSTDATTANGQHDELDPFDYDTQFIGDDAKPT